MFGLRRVRGALLRLVRRRSFSILLGAALMVPAALIEFIPVAAPWWAEGLSVVAGATGIAFVLAGLRGPRPDWFDPGS